MHIFCPECGRDHAVADDKLPGRRFNAICRGCAAKFIVEIEICPHCGGQVQQGQACPCGADGEQAAAAQDDHGESATGTEAKASHPQAPPRPEINQQRDAHQLEFTGSGSEYFRIWIVNLFLTIVTLGIYAAWAKVRTRQYFYSHTLCAGEPFDYLADPMIILRGNLIVGGGFLIYTLTNAFTPLISSLVVLAFGAIFPLLVFKSLRFYARNSAYRNIRFHFLGSLEEAYISYLLLPFLLPFTLGLLFPYWAYRRKRYFFDNFAFGSERNSFAGIPADFYRIYIKAFVIIVLPVIVLVMLLAFAGGMAVGASGGDSSMPATVAVVVGLVYIGFFIASIFAQQYVYARTTNYCWHFSSLGAVKFRSCLQARRLMWIRITNILALIVSAGLLFPWTKVRQSKYIIESLTVITYQGLDDFTAGQADSEDALGEAAMDFFDFEVGL